MKRYVIAIAALGFVLGANAAFADNNWAFDDAYWKAPETVGAVKAPEVGAPTTGERSPYYLVDDFNP